jgi:two-component system response regulator FixJ
LNRQGQAPSFDRRICCGLSLCKAPEMSGHPLNGQGREHVFVVDDDDALRASVVDLLRFAGYEVRAWADAPSFLADIPRVAPAVLVTDMRMPGMTGVELHAEMLRQGRTMPVIYASGESSVPQSIHAMKLGAYEFLVKPFGREELLRAVAGGVEEDRRRMQSLIRRVRFEEAMSVLSPREAQVHHLLLKGYGNREIVETLGISLPTAKQYKSEVMRKLGVRSLAELFAMSETITQDSNPTSKNRPAA